MKYSTIRWTVFICAVTLVFTFLSMPFVKAQKNLTLYSMNNLAQSHYLNPAFSPAAKGYIGLPLGMHSIGATNSGFTYNQLFKSRPQDDSLTIDAENVVRKLGKINFVSVETRNELLGFGFKVKDMYFSFSATNRLDVNFIYPKELIQFIVEGNGKSFIGERASFNKLGVEANSYMEYAIGFNKKVGVNEKLTVGGRVKLLSGIANIATKESKLGIHTDETMFDLTVDGKMRVNSSGIKPFFDTTGTYNAIDAIKNAYSFKNIGIALDLGATYQVTEKIAVNASLLDLGFIKWNEGNANFVSNDVNYTFSGVDAKKFFSDTTDSYWDQLEDTLTTIFSANENNDSYSNMLYTSFYIGGTYQINDFLSTSATIYNQIIRTSYRMGVALAANLRVRNWLTVTGKYSMYGRSFSNLGFGLCLSPGPFQLYVISDNVLGFGAQRSAKNFHINFGMNFLVGNKSQKGKKASTKIE
ncbi:MAG TPA: DUF5723 family protein [Taishania sp.]|nr:DUF5723 family protein [Taishania sp.]